MIPRLNDGLDFHSQALVLRAERQRVLASNIANADTPGYQARDMDFASALRAATGTSTSSSSAGRGGIGGDIATDVMSGGNLGNAAGSTASTALRYGQPAQTNLDNNSVDMDRERAAMAENTMKYEATLKFINNSVRTTLDAMKSYHQG